MIPWRLAAAPVILALLVLALVGAAYPAALWALGKALFPWRASGSPLSLDGVVVGSQLVAQGPCADAYFHPLPSAVPDPYVPINYALEQVPIVSRETGIPEPELRALIYRSSWGSGWPALLFGPGYRVVNVVQLNYEVARALNSTCGR